MSETYLVAQAHSNSNPTDRHAVTRWSKWIAWYGSEEPHLERCKVESYWDTYEEALAERDRLQALQAP